MLNAFPDVPPCLDDHPFHIGRTAGWSDHVKGAKSDRFLEFIPFRMAGGDDDSRTLFPRAVSAQEFLVGSVRYMRIAEYNAHVFLGQNFAAFVQSRCADGVDALADQNCR